MRNRYIIIEPQDDPSTQFQQLCEANPNYSVHLLKRKNDVFIGQRSQSDLSYLGNI